MPVTDLEIQHWVKERYGFVPHPYWIAHCKQLNLLEVERSEGPRKPWHECPSEKRPIFREAFVHFGLLADKPLAITAGSAI